MREGDGISSFATAADDEAASKIAVASPPVSCSCASPIERRGCGCVLLLLLLLLVMVVMGVTVEECGGTPIERGCPSRKVSMRGGGGGGGGRFHAAFLARASGSDGLAGDDDDEGSADGKKVGGKTTTGEESDGSEGVRTFFFFLVVWLGSRAFFKSRVWSFRGPAEGDAWRSSFFSVETVEEEEEENVWSTCRRGASACHRPSPAPMDVPPPLVRRWHSLQFGETDGFPSAFS